ncbi:hypothetical protein GCM10029978_058810 [Actinoallomurus acanthiterrae]
MRELVADPRPPAITVIVVMAMVVVSVLTLTVAVAVAVAVVVLVVSVVVLVVAVGFVSVGVLAHGRLHLSRLGAGDGIGLRVATPPLCAYERTHASIRCARLAGTR